MKNRIFSALLYSLLSATTLVSTASAAPIADYYLCNNREGGEWHYGRTPMVCDGSPFGDDKVVESNYDAVVFDDIANRSVERNRYMNELYAVIRDSAQYYIKKRNPSVSNEELNAWVLAVMATASAETNWSHYRQTTDRRLKFMRGDVGHGHGMMQVDDRSHFPAIQQGIGWNLISNMTYGMDILYAAWLRAPSQSCVSSATNYTARTRSAWAAYNGGPARICRWTNPNDAWARNDQNFYDHLQNKRWLLYVNNTLLPSSVSTTCLMENKENCSGTSAPPPSAPIPTMQSQTLYQTAAGKICILVDDQAQCVSEQRDRLCLNTLDTPRSDVALMISDDLLAKYNPKTWDRHELCSKYEPSLFKVGSSIRFVISINFRATPGGGLLSMVPQGSVLEVLDFEVRNAQLNERYYKVRYNNQTGYVYAGTSQNYLNWIRQAVISETPQALVPALAVARIGQWLQIAIAAGINMRTTAGGALIVAIPKGTKLQVQDVVIRGAANEVYYKVIYNGRVGYIYSGVLLPISTVKSWTTAL